MIAIAASRKLACTTATGIARRAMIRTLACVEWVWFVLQLITILGMTDLTVHDERGEATPGHAAPEAADRIRDEYAEHLFEVREAVRKAQQREQDGLS